MIGNELQLIPYSFIDPVNRLVFRIYNTILSDLLK